MAHSCIHGQYLEDIHWEDKEDEQILKAVTKLANFRVSIRILVHGGSREVANQGGGSTTHLSSLPSNFLVFNLFF